MYTPPHRTLYHEATAYSLYQHQLPTIINSTSSSDCEQTLLYSQKSCFRYFKIGQNKLKTKSPPPPQTPHPNWHMFIKSQIGWKLNTLAHHILCKSAGAFQTDGEYNHTYTDHSHSLNCECVCIIYRLYTISRLIYDLVNKPLLKCFKICKAATIQILVSVSCIGFKKKKKKKKKKNEANFMKLNTEILHWIHHHAITIFCKFRIITKKKREETSHADW